MHAERDDAQAKFWLDPVSVAVNHGFSAEELNTVEAIVVENAVTLRKAWDDFFAG